MVSSPLTATPVFSSVSTASHREHGLAATGNTHPNFAHLGQCVLPVNRTVHGRSAAGAEPRSGSPPVPRGRETRRRAGSLGIEPETHPPRVARREHVGQPSWAGVMWFKIPNRGLIPKSLVRSKRSTGLLQGEDRRNRHRDQERLVLISEDRLHFPQSISTDRSGNPGSWEHEAACDISGRSRRRRASSRASGPEVPRNRSRCPVGALSTTTLSNRPSRRIRARSARAMIFIQPGG